MISVGFKRVSQKRPCRICSKPTFVAFKRRWYFRLHAHQCVVSRAPRDLNRNKTCFPKQVKATSPCKTFMEAR